MYQYYAHVDSVYDGDTITATVELGFHVQMQKLKFRLYGINTPEIRGGTEETKAAGRAARDRLRELILGKRVLLYTQKDKTGKYGRWIATVHMQAEGCEDFTHMVNVNRMLVKEGHAVEKEY